MDSEHGPRPDELGTEFSADGSLANEQEPVRTSRRPSWRRSFRRPRAGKVLASGMAIAAIGGATAEQASADFSVDRTTVYQNEMVTATDTTELPPGPADVQYYWACDVAQTFTEGGPTAQCTFPETGSQGISQKVYVDGNFYDSDTKVFDVLPDSARPGGIELLSPDAIELPDTVVFQSKKQDSTLDCTTAGGQVCEALPQGVTGPDATGHYQHRYTVPVAGESLQLHFETYNFDPDTAETMDATLAVTGNEVAPFALASKVVNTPKPARKPDFISVNQKKYEVSFPDTTYYDTDDVMQRVKTVAKWKTPSGQTRTAKKVLKEQEGQQIDRSPYESVVLDGGGMRIKKSWTKSRAVKLKLTGTVKSLDTGQTHYRKTVKATYRKGS